MEIDEKLSSEELAEQRKDSVLYGCKSVNVKVEDVDTNTGVVTGFYNTMNFLDSDMDVSMIGSFNKTIKDRGPESDAIAKFKHMRDHDWGKVTGIPHVLKEKTINVKGVKTTGLYFEVKINSKSDNGRNQLADYEAGVIDNHSIGFAYGKLNYYQADTDQFKEVVDTLINPSAAIGIHGLYSVSEYKGFEGSSVAFGSNEWTPFLGMKSGTKGQKLDVLLKKVDILQRVLKNGTQTDDHLEGLKYRFLQLKQAIQDYVSEPSLKDTLDKPPREDTSKSDMFLKYISTQ